MQNSTRCQRLLPQKRHYAISVSSPRVQPNMKPIRVFKGHKAYQYNVYAHILTSNRGAPVLFLSHDSFTANRIIKLRQAIVEASEKLNRITAKTSPDAPPRIPPKLSFVKSSILGATLRTLPGVDVGGVQQMVNGVKSGYALLSFPSMDPPHLAAVTSAMNRSVPPRPPKSTEELKKEEEAKNADPATPGRRVKKQRIPKTPELKVAGALIDGKVFMPKGVEELSKMPTLETLQQQIVGLLSSPAVQLAAVMSEAGGGRLARTLEGLKKSLEDSETPPNSSP